MKTKVTFLLLLAITAISTAQVDEDYIYLKATIDPNNALGVIDNPRTETETTGIDFDIEAGARYKRVAVYLTYGRFGKIGYQNYAVGVDHYVPILKNIQTSIGFNYGVVMRRDDNYYFSDFDPINEPVWGGSGAVAFRASVEIPIVKEKLDLTLTSQYQQRPELNQFIFEGVVGLKYKFARKNKKNFSRWKR